MDNAKDRGNIYEFINKDGEPNGKALVISSQKRCRDNLVSILKLSPVGNGTDAVAIAYNSQEGIYWYVHCGCVSYAYKDKLGKRTGEVSEQKMREIDDRIREQLGLDGIASYKDLYEDLLQKVVDRVELKAPEVNLKVGDKNLTDLVGDWDDAVDNMVM